MSEVSCEECGEKMTLMTTASDCKGCKLTQRAPSEKKLLIHRCSRVEGQIRGIKRMIEEDIYCDDVLNQVAAAQSALSALSRILLEQHMKSCLVDRIKNNDEAVIDEIMGTINKLIK